MAVHVYSQRGGKFTSNYHGDMSFKKIKEEFEVLIDNQHDEFPNSKTGLSHDHVSGSQYGNFANDESSCPGLDVDDDDDDDDDDDNMSVKSMQSYQSQNSAMSEGAKNWKKRSSDEELKVEAYFQTYEEIVRPCKCSEIGCAAYINFKQVIFNLVTTSIIHLNCTY